MHCPESAVQRFITNKASWKKWWPGTYGNDSIYLYRDCNIQILQVLLNGVKTSCSTRGVTSNAYLQVFSSTDSTSDLVWSCNKKLPANIFQKITAYIVLQTQQAQVKDLMDSVKIFFENEQDVYGFTTQVQLVKDTSLIAVKKVLDHYPATGEVYQLIDDITHYIQQNRGQEVSHPMLNVYQESPAVYNVMVAVPIEKDMQGNNVFQLKKMLPGELIAAQISGGPYTIRKSEAELKNYIDDYKRVSPAIPYQSLITDRRSEHDTAKWITILYYPVFHK